MLSNSQAKPPLACCEWFANILYTLGIEYNAFHIDLKHHTKTLILISCHLVTTEDNICTSDCNLLCLFVLHPVCSFPPASTMVAELFKHTR